MEFDPATTAAIASACALVLSEVLGTSKTKSNSLIQLGISVFKAMANRQ